MQDSIYHMTLKLHLNCVYGQQRLKDPGNLHI